MDYLCILTGYLSEILNDSLSLVDQDVILRLIQGMRGVNESPQKMGCVLNLLLTKSSTLYNLQ